MKTYITHKLAAYLLPLAVVLGLIVPAFSYAEISASADLGVGIKTTLGENQQQKVETKADTAVTERINALTSLKERINAIAHVSDGTKASLSASIDATIASLQSLKVKIDSDTSAASIRADAKEMITATRIYMLVIPQARIAAAADRVGVIVDMMTALNTKVQTRISIAQAAGKDLSVTTALETDMMAKLADAKIQAAAAVTASAGLTADNGDKTKASANEAALKTARTSLKAAEMDLKAAREDMKKILIAIKDTQTGAKAEGEADTSSSVTQ